MIAEAGLVALWLGAALCALQLVLTILTLRTPLVLSEVEGRVASASPGARASTSLSTNGEEMGPDGAMLAKAIRPVAVAQGLLTCLAFALLILLFIRVDLSVLLVAQNDHSEKPFLYRFAASWGNHEGSMLMWVSILSVAGAAVAVLERRLNERTLIATLGGQAAIALGFYAFLLFASNPFARLTPPAMEGQGLNPLLQDPGLAFHPPTLYIGYVGLSVAFSFAIGALVTRDVGPAFARAMRPWVLGAWIFLTIGITAGSYWAYYELGWGGWWFWDPVENASLMPWLAATALLHSVTVLATRDGLRAWTVMLGVVAFSMSMVGTFLVRSGILTSVHAFAVDPRRGSFLLALLALYIGGALVLFALRVGTVREGSRFDALSREGALVLNNLLLTVILGIVLVGTLYPLILEGLTGDKLSVGPPYFNSAAGPLALLLCMAMVAGPLMRWRREDVRPLLRRLAPAAALVVVALIAIKLFAPPIGLLPLLGLGLSFGIGLGSIEPLFGRNLRRTPLFTWGMVVAHFGIGVALAGMACDSAFTVEKLVAASVGETIPVGPWRVKLASVTPGFGPNWTSMESTLEVERGGAPRTLRPQARYYWAPPTETSESAILTVWNGQLYTVLGSQAEGGRWQLRLWWKPFVTLIWAGGGLIGLGGFLALIGRLLRERRSAKNRELYA
ncbi:heme lyase CcmF/NrfE family subunit [Sphingomonas sp. BIUV-7]|uniref:Heme lyase CcmF/NrfE family subunit n=1 Tax=Sphingomonas natans TaxID=3063330 RepID=A0ABT8Y396_9SPHN|nr:heme lyase CcmF/NrfE family subunit [Sphingomonas sp. BIUV-7]MDO6412776.1 heme lyase CcmF/NrfE family subunit [Sphingomonas sp. BIUV-7]